MFLQDVRPTMSDPWISPGQAANDAFGTGMKAAALLAVCGVGILYWAGVIESASAVVALILWLPVYFVFAAVALSKWLGLDPGIADLRPVSPEE
jgi:hypothetical protein